MSLSNDQKLAYKLMDSGSNVFLTGKAGTGKSYLLDYFIKEKQKDGKSVIVTAPTGVAAINVNGATLHRTFKIPFDIISIFNGPKALLNAEIIRAADVFIIDEISMVRKDIFEYVMKYISRCKKNIQIIFTGDFLQLESVLTAKDAPIYRNLYGNMDTFCFQSPMWLEFAFNTVELKEVIRQDNNSKLVENLNKARVGDPTCIPYFNQFVGKKIDTTEAIEICGTNNDAFRINKAKLDSLPGSYRVKEAIIKGDVKKSDMPTDEKLFLKEGCRVMTLINNPEQNYYNGTLGTILRISNETIDVELDNGHIASVERYQYDIKEYQSVDEKESSNTDNEDFLEDFFKDYSESKDENKPKIEVEEENDKPNKKVIKLVKVGSFTQFPLKVAFAITIHKSQGQTFENLIIHPRSWSYGQLYVALSRCKDEKGLSLASPIYEKYLKANPEVVNFYYNPVYEKELKAVKEKLVKDATLKFVRNLSDYSFESYNDFIKGNELIDIKVPIKNKDIIEKAIMAINKFGIEENVIINDNI